MQGRTGQDNQPERRRSAGRDLSNGTGQHRAIDGTRASYRDLPPGSTERLRALAESTGQHRAIPRRPLERRRIENAPQTPRVARPRRAQTPPRKLRHRLLIASGIFVVVAIVAYIAGLTLFNLLNGLSAGSAAGSTAADFLIALGQQNYDQAYKDLGPAITLHVSPDHFAQQAQSYDHCFGPITHYAEVANSTTASNTNSMVYHYSVTRKNTSKPFQLQLALQQDQTTGTWKISDYGNTLGPGAPTCK